MQDGLLGGPRVFTPVFYVTHQVNCCCDAWRRNYFVPQLDWSHFSIGFFLFFFCSSLEKWQLQLSWADNSTKVVFDLWSYLKKPPATPQKKIIVKNSKRDSPDHWRCYNMVFELVQKLFTSGRRHRGCNNYSLAGIVASSEEQPEIGHPQHPVVHLKSTPKQLSVIRHPWLILALFYHGENFK